MRQVGLARVSAAVRSDRVRGTPEPANESGIVKHSEDMPRPTREMTR